MDFWDFFNWLWGGTDVHEILWPWDYPEFMSWVIGIGFAEFVVYRLIAWQIGKHYGSWHGFYHFVILPAYYKIEPDSPEGLKVLLTQERYVSIQKRQKAK